MFHINVAEEIKTHFVSKNVLPKIVPLMK